MSRVLFLVGIGGFLGSVSRYLASTTLSRVFPVVFPYGTFTVNLAGCFLIGIIYGLSERYQWLTPEWRFFFASGFCGGFTTFSSFAFENIQLMQQSNYWTLALYSVGSFALGLLAVFIGLSFTKI